ncbi:MAG: DUF47 domain-containing protein [Candidatus Eisenbacteria bacterium]|nr:DUF47 domain-containing protein [Candidatus Eisenbacteria bacterium]
MIRRLFSHGEEYFELFERAAAHVVSGARSLVELIEARTPQSEMVGAVLKIKDIEHACDDVTHQTLARLNKTFITPLDREDIHLLITELDDILDLIDEAAGRLAIYRVDLSVRHTVRAAEIARILLRTTEKVETAVRQLRTLKRPETILAACVEVNNLEDEADEAFRLALSELFARETDPIVIMVWKELYEKLEAAVDDCEDLANLLEGIVIKHA